MLLQFVEESFNVTRGACECCGCEGEDHLEACTGEGCANANATDDAALRRAGVTDAAHIAAMLATPPAEACHAPAVADAGSRACRRSAA